MLNRCIQIPLDFEVMAFHGINILKLTIEDALTGNRIRGYSFFYIKILSISNRDIQH